MKLKCKIAGKKAVIVDVDGTGVVAIIKQPIGYAMGHVASDGTITPFSQVELVDQYVLEFLEDYHGEFKA